MNCAVQKICITFVTYMVAEFYLQIVVFFGMNMQPQVL